MKTKHTLKRKLLLYIGFSGAVFVILYSIVIASYFGFAFDLHSKIIFENEAKNYLAEYQIDSSTALPENSTLRSYRSLVDVPQVLLALHTENKFFHTPLLGFLFEKELKHSPSDMVHGQMKIFERDEFDQYQDIFDIDTLCFNDRCELVFFYSYNLHDDEWLYMVMGLPDTEKDKLHDAEFDNAAKFLLSIAILFLITILVLTTLLINKIVRPIGNLAKWSENLTLSSLEEDIPDLKFKELDSVAVTLKSAFTRINIVLANEKDFLNSASHELRTPIAVLSTNLALLEAVMAELPKDSQELKVIDRLVRAVENMKQLTQTLLWLSKEPEDFPVAVEVDLAQLFPKLIKENNYLANHKQIEVKLHLKECKIIAPEVLCKIVLSNLIRNAFQHTQQGTVEITFKANEIEITNVCSANEISTLMEVDYGFGLGLELVNRISQKLSWQFSSKAISGGRSVTLNFQ